MTRNLLPVPATQFGAPGPGGTFNHFDLASFPVPPNAASVEVRLLYQATSWEYIQFLWKQNSGTDPFLGQEGVNMLDAWLNTGMAPPFEMAAVTAAISPVALPAPGNASGPLEPPMAVTSYDQGTGAIGVTYAPACDATAHTIHYGPLANVRTYGWQAADCTLNASGSVAFIPDPAVGGSIFWVIVGTNPDWEGSYGTSSSSVQRPPSASAGICARPQSLAPVCE